MNRFYLIDKPLYVSSFDVIRVLRKKLNIFKMGHTGTLDPLATGCLLVAVGNYTKLVPYLEKERKIYEFSLNLDGITDSYDLAEKIQFISNDLQEKYKKEITIEKIQEIIDKNFTGKITQIPPKYSALKINGKKACDLVREGKDIEMKIRKVEIFNIQILDYNYPSLTIRAEVSAGTYIRSIVSDLGNILGTGAYVTKLRRTRIGDLDINLSVNLDNFNELDYLRVKDLFKNREFIELEQDVLKKINNGLQVVGDFDFKVGVDLFVVSDNEVTNIVEYDGKKLFAKRKI